MTAPFVLIWKSAQLPGEEQYNDTDSVVVTQKDHIVNQPLARCITVRIL